MRSENKETEINYDLRLRLSVVIAKTSLSFSSKIKDFKIELKKKFNVSYSLDEIEKELELLKFANEDTGVYTNPVLYPEDYFEGFGS